MAWTNASGNPVAMTSQTLQIDIPDECAASLGAINWMAVISAVMALGVALATKNPAAIAQAMQALINAIMGNG